jgi:hypothetical protein
MSRRGAITATVLVAIGLVAILAICMAHTETRCPSRRPTPGCWYDRGVDALREGAFAGAKRLSRKPSGTTDRYVQAYARLAERKSELDDESGAKDALIHVSDLVPDRTRLDPEDQTATGKPRSSVGAAKHDEAIRAYTQLACPQARKTPARGSTWAGPKRRRASQ